MVPLLLPCVTPRLASIAAWCGSDTTAVATCLNVAARTRRAERAVQGDVLSVWQVLHGTPRAPLISAQRVARFDDHCTSNLLINNKLRQRYSRFILVYLKTYALQVVHGRLFGMVQGKAHQWIHVLLPALLAALRALGDAPARSLTALAQRLGVSEADAATVVVPLEEEPAPVAPIPAATSTSPLVPMMGPNGVSSVPKTRLNRRSAIAARKRTIRSKMSSWSMRSSPSSF